MRISVEVKRKNPDAAKNAKTALINQAREVVLRHALGAASVAYQIYPVGPEHVGKNAGTPHTRDTFAIALGDEVIASQGQFWEAVGTQIDEGKPFTVKLLTAGASFFLEWGTVFMEAQPILRMVVKQAQADISSDLRTINIGLSKL